MDARKQPEETPLTRTVLLVDSDEKDGSAVGRYLETRGWTARCVAGGRAAIRACLLDAPAVVLTDVDAQDMDGFELAATLAAGEARPAVVFFTRRAPGDADRTELLAALGVTSILRRPCTFDVIASAIDALVGERSEPRASGVVSLAPPGTGTGKEQRS